VPVRSGYAIIPTCTQPTELMFLLSVHEDRAAGIRILGRT
jgi:hypothetical protein